MFKQDCIPSILLQSLSSATPAPSYRVENTPAAGRRLLQAQGGSRVSVNVDTDSSNIQAAQDAISQSVSNGQFSQSLAANGDPPPSPHTKRRILNSS